MSESSPAAVAAPALPLRAFPDLLRLLSARVATTIANQMLMLALGWQMYDLTGSAWQLGLVGLAQFVPALVFALPAGHLVDRHDRRRTLLLALGIQSLVAALLALGSLQGWLGAPVILGVSMLLGVARAVQMPSQQALLPALVTAAALPRAVAASSATMQGAIVAGPALGGLVYAFGPALASRWADGPHTGAALVYALSLVLMGAGALGVRAIRSPARAVRRVGSEPGALTAGLRFIAAQPVLLGALSLDLFAVLLGGATALLPIFARDILHVGPAGLGLLRAAPAVGAFACGLWLARHPLQRHAGRWLLAGVAVYGLATVVFGLARTPWLACLALAVSGAGDMLSVVIRQSLVQLETPDDMRGRVAAVNSVFIGASNQLGEFESGATAAWLGPVGSVLLGGLGTLGVVLAWVRLFPALCRRDRLVSAPD